MHISPAHLLLLLPLILGACSSGTRSGPYVNQVPTMDPIANQTTNVGAGAQIVNLTGVSIGIGDVGQNLMVTATSNNLPVVANPIITGTGATRTLTYTPLTIGTATITVTVVDDGGTLGGGVDTLVLTFDIGVFIANLVINEIDYDTGGASADDDQGREFVEIFNGTGAAVPLADIELYFVNGATGANYGAAQPLLLSGGGATLPAGAYLVVADSVATLGLIAGPNLLVIDLGNLGDRLQNGPSDGFILYNTTSNTVLDAVGYGGPIVLAADIDGNNTFNIGETNPTPTDPAASTTDSVGRNATSDDTDDNAADFSVIAVGTPGAVNP